MSDITDTTTTPEARADADLQTQIDTQEAAFTVPPGEDHPDEIAAVTAIPARIHEEDLTSDLEEAANQGLGDAIANAQAGIPVTATEKGLVADPDVSPETQEARKRCFSIANTLGLVLNGNEDPRTWPEWAKDEARTFLREAAAALAATK